MKTKLAEVTEIQFGATFKQLDKTGDILYLQARNFDANGELRNNEPFQYVHPHKGIEKAILKNGDVIFAAKGSRNTASVYYSKYGSAVASSTFYVLHFDQNKILPMYLAFYLNLTKTQNYFLSNRSIGTTIPSIKKQELEDLEILIPTLFVQKKIVELKNLCEFEKVLISSLTNKKEVLYQSLYNKILSGEHK